MDSSPSVTPVRRTRTPRSSRRRRITPRFFWMSMILVLALYLSYGYADGFIKMIQLQRAIHQVRQQTAAYQVRNQQLREELARLESDAYVEQVARRELGLVMPGEQSYVIVTEDQQ